MRDFSRIVYTRVVSSLSIGIFPMTVNHQRQIYLHKHSRREFRERMQSGELQACIIPVAATEQHLEHLSMEHDWRSVMHISLEVARRLAPRVIVAPAMN